MLSVELSGNFVGELCHKFSLLFGSELSMGTRGKIEVLQVLIALGTNVVRKSLSDVVVDQLTDIGSEGREGNRVDTNFVKSIYNGPMKINKNKN